MLAKKLSFIFVYNFQLILFIVLVHTKFEHVAGFLFIFVNMRIAI